MELEREMKETQELLNDKNELSEKVNVYKLSETEISVNIMM